MWLESEVTGLRFRKGHDRRTGLAQRANKRRLMWILQELDEKFCLKDMNTCDDHREPLQYRNEEQLTKVHSGVEEIEIKLPNWEKRVISRSMGNFAERLAELNN